MGDLFFEMGRKLGRVAIPVMRRAKWTWRSLTGTEAESIQAETELGKAMAAGLRLRMGPAGRGGDAELIGEIGRRLGACVRNKARTFKAEVVQTGSPTAFALPGGFVFLDVALLDLCGRNANELAFVVGHEMAHVIRRHAVDRLVARVGLNVISTLLSRGALAAWWRQSGVQVLQSAYARDSEEEADELGLRLAQAAGYDPDGAFRLLERLEELGRSPGGLGDYFASHPSAAERCARLKRVMAGSG